MLEREIQKQRMNGQPVSPGLLATYEKLQQEMRQPTPRTRANNSPDPDADKQEWKRWYESKRGSLSAKFGGFDEDVLEVFYRLTLVQLDALIEHYGTIYGAQGERYARQQYSKWKANVISPSAQTVERLLDSLPEILPFEEKCRLLSKLRDRYRRRESHSVEVEAETAMETIRPLALRIIERARSSEIPAAIEARLRWLSSGDVVIAKKILAEVEVQEGRDAIRLLDKDAASQASGNYQVQVSSPVLRCSSK